MTVRHNDLQKCSYTPNLPLRNLIQFLPTWEFFSQEVKRVVVDVKMLDEHDAANRGSLSHRVLKLRAKGVIRFRRILHLNFAPRGIMDRRARI